MGQPIVKDERLLSEMILQAKSLQRNIEHAQYDDASLYQTHWLGRAKDLMAKVTEILTEVEKY